MKITNDKLFYEIYDDYHKSKDKTKITIYQSIDLWSHKLLQIYPTSDNITTNNYIFRAYNPIKNPLRFPSKLPNYDKIKQIYESTLILIAISKNYKNFCTSIGTNVNIQLVETETATLNFRGIITSYSLLFPNANDNIINDKTTDKQSINNYYKIYGFYPSSFPTHSVRNLLNSVEFILYNEIEVEDKGKEIDELFKSSLIKIFEYEIDDHFWKIRETFVTDHIKKNQNISEVFSTYLLNVWLLSPYKTETESKDYIPWVINNMNCRVKNPKDFFTISSIPFIDLYNQINKNIPLSEDTYYNNARLFSENVLSLVYGKRASFNTQNDIKISFANYYKNKQLSGELLYDIDTCAPFGIGTIDSYYTNTELLNSMQGFIPFNNNYFKNLFLLYFGREEIIVKPPIFWIFKVKNTNPLIGSNEKGRQVNNQVANFTKNISDFFFEENFSYNMYKNGCFTQEKNSDIDIEMDEEAKKEENGNKNVKMKKIEISNELVNSLNRVEFDQKMCKYIIKEKEKERVAIENKITDIITKENNHIT